MKSFKSLFGIGIAIAMMDFGVAMADIQIPSLQRPLSFTITMGDGSTKEITFIDTIDEHAQMTCMMTPGGMGIHSLPNLPPVPIPIEHKYTAHSTLSSWEASSINHPPYYTPHFRPYRPPFPPIPEDPEDPEDPNIIPEPTTLAILGTGIGTAILARYLYKKFYRPNSDKPSNPSASDCQAFFGAEPLESTTPNQRLWKYLPYAPFLLTPLDHNQDS